MTFEEMTAERDAAVEALHEMQMAWVKKYEELVAAKADIERLQKK